MKKENSRIFSPWDYFKTKKRAEIALGRARDIEGMEDALRDSWFYSNTGIDGSMREEAWRGEILNTLPEGIDLDSIQYQVKGTYYGEWTDNDPDYFKRHGIFYEREWVNNRDKLQWKMRNDIPDNEDSYGFSLVEGYFVDHHIGEPVYCDAENIWLTLCTFPCSEEEEIQCDRDGKCVYYYHGPAHMEIFLKIPLCHLSQEELTWLHAVGIISAKEHNIAILLQYGIICGEFNKEDYTDSSLRTWLYKFCAYYHLGQSDPIYSLTQYFLPERERDQWLHPFDEEERKFLESMDRMSTDMRREMI